MLLINDLARHAAGVQGVVGPAVSRVIERGWYVLGEECRGFEAEFAAYCGAAHCLGVANGTDALEIALRALGVGVGSRVATVANAAFYGMTALAAIGAEPVFIDVDPENHLMDLAQLRAVVSRGEADAIIATHLYGLLHDMEAVMAIATSGPRKLPVLEDCAQAHGAVRDGRRAGSFGDAAAFSFYPTKNLGAVGDGGAIATNDAQVAQLAGRLRQYGWDGKYAVAESGGRNSRLDELQAAVLRQKLPYLDGWNARRRAIAAHYQAKIQHPNVTVPPAHGAESVAHLYVVRSNDRDGLRRHLSGRGVASDIHYPIPDHRQKVMAGRPVPSLPVTEALAGQVLTLPCFPEMTDDEIHHVAMSVNAWK